MTEMQRFEKAKAHLDDALNYRHPRPETEALDTPVRFRYLYRFHTSGVW